MLDFYINRENISLTYMSTRFSCYKGVKYEGYLMYRLAQALQKYHIKRGNKLCFSNGMTLNRLSLEMWERLGFRGIDSSVLSKVIHGKRLFSLKQLRIFCDVMNLPQSERNYLFEILAKDIMTKLGINATNTQFYIPTQYLALVSNKSTSTSIGQIITLLSKPSAIFFKDLVSLLIPKKNSSSIIGVALSDHAYYELIGKGIQTTEQALNTSFAGFDVSIPYCGFTATVSGLKDNCRCGYHLALYGVIKEALRLNIYSAQEIQNEIGRWVSYFFPKETVVAYLQKSIDPNQQTQQLIKELNNI